jgi:hypothetical protein
MIIKHGVLDNLYKIINLQLHKNTLQIKCIFMVHATYLNLKAKIKFSFLKEFKVSEILHVFTFDIICIFNFGTNYVHTPVTHKI